MARARQQAAAQALLPVVRDHACPVCGSTKHRAGPVEAGAPVPHECAAHFARTAIRQLRGA